MRASERATDTRPSTRHREVSPQRYAHVGGAVYLVIIAVALFGEVFVRGRLVVWGDPGATASNILASETLFRVALAGDLLTCVLDVGMAQILFVLLEPVSRNLALLSAFFRVAFVAVYAVAKLFLVAALIVLTATDQLQAFGPEQRSELAHLALRLHGQGFSVALILFGLTCMVVGLLVRRSGYLPRAIGVLLVVGGAGYLVSSFSLVLDPPLAARLFPWVGLPAFVAELGLALWLLVKGVDAAGWERLREARR